MKKWVITLMCIFFLPIITLALISVLMTDKGISEDENRTLAVMPEFSMKNWFDESFALGFEEYFADQFPFREQFMHGNKNMNKFYIFTPSFVNNEPVLIAQDDDAMMEGGGVFLGEDEYFDPMAEVEETTDNTEATATALNQNAEPTPSPDAEADYPDEEDAKLASSSMLVIDDMAVEVTTKFDINIDYYAEVLNRAATYAEDTQFYSMLIPTSGQFYSPEKYHTGEYDQKIMIDRAYDGFDNVTGVDAYSNLYEHMDEYIYFRTDHHWTALGAYYGYLAFCESAEIEPVPLEEFEYGKYERFLGSLYLHIKDNPLSDKMLENPDYLEYYLPINEANAKYYISRYMETSVPVDIVNITMSYKYSNKYLCFLAGDCPLIEINTDVDNGKSIFVIKESFANCFIPYLTSHYETIYAYDPRKFNSAAYPREFRIDWFMREHEVDDVLVMNNTMMINSRGFAQLIEAAYPPQ